MLTHNDLQIIALHAQPSGKLIGVGVHIYMFVAKKNLNHTLAIDSPFQTFVVGLLVKL